MKVIVQHLVILRENQSIGSHVETGEGDTDSMSSEEYFFPLRKTSRLKWYIFL
jgi:hypothetical protein